jgi:NADH dehydrogenase FAD-containing subunit
MKHILIVGHGFVGKAVEHGFKTSNCEVTVCDPKYNVYLDDLLDTVRPGESRFDATFVCVPTPFGEGGTIDDSCKRCS